MTPQFVIPAPAFAGIDFNGNPRNRWRVLMAGHLKQETTDYAGEAEKGD